MASGAGSLTSYNSELVKCIEDLREQREELNRSILRDEEDKARIQKVYTIGALRQRLTGGHRPSNNLIFLLSSHSSLRRS